MKFSLSLSLSFLNFFREMSFGFEFISVFMQSRVFTYIHDLTSERGFIISHVILAHVNTRENVLLLVMLVLFVYRFHSRVSYFP